MVKIEKSDARKKEELFNRVTGLARRCFPNCNIHRDTFNQYSFSVFTRASPLKRIFDVGSPVIELSCGEAEVEVYTPTWLDTAKGFAEQYQKMIGAEVTLYTNF
ncbi:hypothetical protein HYT23_02505 [Candidatus Pacearchaeota archaeon]|nr:hypothetical protein [Candidatus Pacearchaeota archaeon]